MIKSVEDLDSNGKSVFVRADFNVPLSEGRIAETHRIDSTLPTIECLLGRARKVILASHLGRPKAKTDDRWTLRPVAEYLASRLDAPVAFLTDPVDAGLGRRTREETGAIVLLENLRFDPGEEANDPDFAESLAQLAQIYVNDAFGTAHRAHASTAGMVRYFHEKGAGLLFKKEIDYFTSLLNASARPFVAVLGGAKVSDKIGVIRNLLTKVDRLIIGGAMAYTFLKAKGLEVGKSLVEKDFISLASDLIEEAKDRQVDLVLPVDHIASPQPDDTAHVVTCTGPIRGDLMGLDIGPETAAYFSDRIDEAKMVLWNGPLGLFETDAFSHGTMAFARNLATKEATTIIAGGDTVAAVTRAGVAADMTHLSTGGGATLELLEGKTLPGVAALESEAENARA